MARDRFGKCEWWKVLCFMWLPFGKSVAWPSGGRVSWELRSRCGRGLWLKPQIPQPPTSTFSFRLRTQTVLVGIDSSTVSNSDYLCFWLGPSSTATFMKLFSLSSLDPRHFLYSLYYALPALRGFAVFSFPLHPAAHWEASTSSLPLLSGTPREANELWTLFCPHRLPLCLMGLPVCCLCFQESLILGFDPICIFFFKRKNNFS